MQTQFLVDLTSVYTEPTRHYHNLGHINQMLTFGQRITGNKLSREQILAIWFHDYVCVPGAKDNEVRSADFFKSVALSAYETNDINSIMRVYDIIIDTGMYKPRTEESALVCDLDMSILGTTRVKYADYQAQVMAEYLTAFEAETYYNGRTEFLNALLLRPKIFNTDLLKGLEIPARQNINEEIDKLKGLLSAKKKNGKA